jgi:hypothetical protein
LRMLSASIRLSISAMGTAASSAGLFVISPPRCSVTAQERGVGLSAR